jgi:dienelactone hydrolase
MTTGTPQLQLTSAETATELDFRVTIGEREVPGTLWRPGAATGAPLLAMQHGGSGHRRDATSCQLARVLVEQIGCAVLVIDGPVHGERRRDWTSSGEVPRERMLEEFIRFWEADGAIDRVVEDWRAAIDAVEAAGLADTRRLGWIGMSMGCAYGVPLCAVEHRIQFAALGMFGLNWAHAERLRLDAAQITCPVMFHVQTKDEFFPLDQQRALFDAIGSADKRWREYPGTHGAPAPAQLADLIGYLSEAFSGF